VSGETGEPQSSTAAWSRASHSATQTRGRSALRGRGRRRAPAPGACTWRRGSTVVCESPLLATVLVADRARVRSWFVVSIIPVCAVLAGCAGADSGTKTSLGRGWIRAAESICARQSQASRHDLRLLEQASAHGEKAALIRYYNNQAAVVEATSEALRARIKAPRGSLPYQLVASSAVAAQGLRQQARAVQSGNPDQIRKANVMTTDGTVPFLLLAAAADMRACADDGETAAVSSPAERVAFQASSDAAWLCETHGERVPSIYRSMITADLRKLARLAAESPRERVRFVTGFHPSFTYRALAKDAAAALGSSGCADDPTLVRLRAKLDPEPATSPT